MKRIVAGAAAALSLAFAGQAHAQTAPSCGGQFTGETACSFEYGGGSIYVSIGMGTDPLGAGTVRLEADIAAPAPAQAKKTHRGKRARSAPAVKAPVRKVLLTCQAFGMYGICGAGQSGTEDLMKVGTPMHCMVLGRTSSPGRFECGSQSDAQTGAHGEIHNP